MNYQKVVKEKLKLVNDSMIHLYPDITKLNMYEEIPFNEMYLEDKYIIGKILLENEFYSFIISSLLLFNIDSETIYGIGLNEISSKLVGEVGKIPTEHKVVLNYITEKIIPYCVYCRDNLAISSNESFMDLLHLLDQLSFISGNIKCDEEARVTWLFDWFSMLQSDVKYYKLLN